MQIHILVFSLHISGWSNLFPTPLWTLLTLFIPPAFLGQNNSEWVIYHTQQPLGMNQTFPKYKLRDVDMFRMCSLRIGSYKIALKIVILNLTPWMPWNSPRIQGLHQRIGRFKPTRTNLCVSNLTPSFFLVWMFYAYSCNASTLYTYSCTAYTFYIKWTLYTNLLCYLTPGIWVWKLCQLCVCDDSEVCGYRWGRVHASCGPYHPPVPWVY